MRTMPVNWQNRRQGRKLYVVPIRIAICYYKAMINNRRMHTHVDSCRRHRSRNKTSRRAGADCV